jgi:hypothetical protein
METGLTRAESEIGSELNKLRAATARLMDDITALSSRLTPVLKHHDPRPETPNKEVEVAASPVGDQIRQARKSVEVMNETIALLISELAV